MSGYQDEKYQQKLRLDFDEAHQDVPAVVTTLQVRDEILKRQTDRTVATGIIEDASGGVLKFKTLKTAGGSQVVGGRRDQLDFDNRNNNIEFMTIQALVTRHMVAYFPEDEILDEFSGTWWPVMSVEKTDWPGDDTYSSDEVVLSDHQGVELTGLDSDANGATVTFKDTLKVDPSDYDLYYQNQSTMLFVLIPRPTGVDLTDQYRIDCVTGEITLRAPWFAARPTYTTYTFWLNMARMARSNETMEEHITEPRTILEEIKGTLVALGSDEMQLTARRSWINKHGYKLDPVPTNPEIRAPELDYHKLTAPFPISTSGPGSHGFTLETGYSEDDADVGYTGTASVNLPLLTIVDSAFLSIPDDWTISSASLRFKATLGSSVRRWRDPLAVKHIDTSFDPDFGCGWVYETQPAEQYCLNVDRNLDDDDAEPRCRLRGPGPSGPSNVELYARADDNDHNGTMLAALTSTSPSIEIIDSVGANLIWNDYGNADGGWAHNCELGPPGVPGSGERVIPQPRSQSHFFTTFGGETVRRTQFATEALWMEDLCYRRNLPVVEPKVSAGITCSFLRALNWTMPAARSTSSFKADGDWHIMDITDTMQDIHDRKNSVPGRLALMLGPGVMTDFFIDLAGGAGDYGWGEAITQNRKIGDDVSDFADMYGWQPNSYDISFEIADAELYVEIQTPSGIIAPLAASMQLAGLDAPAP